MAFKTFALASLLLTALSLVAVPPAAAVTPVTDIVSAGPLKDIYIGTDLSCQVSHVNDPGALEFYPSSAIPGDCGTFLVAQGTLFTPDFSNHGGTATGAITGATVFTSVSQSAVSGSGTVASPFKVVTVADAGSSRLRITESDSYVVGDDHYRTDVQITNVGSTSQSFTLFRAADCYLGGSDQGYRVLDLTTGIVGCTQNPNDSPSGRYEEWVPHTAGSHAYEAPFSTVWSHINGHTAFTDVCDCTTLEDNGAGLSWTATAPAGSSLTFSHDLRFSVPPQQPPPSNLGATCASEAVLISQLDLTGQVGDSRLPFSQSAAKTQFAPGAPIAPPRTVEAPGYVADHADAALFAPSHAFNNGLTLSARGVYSRCDVVANDSGTRFAQAFGEAGIAELRIASCPVCPDLVHLEAVEQSLVAWSDPSGVHGMGECDVAELESMGTMLAGICPAPNTGLSNNVNGVEVTVVLNELLAPVRDANGLWSYEGSAVHARLVVPGVSQVDVYVGHVVVAVPGIEPTPPIWVPHECATPACDGNPIGLPIGPFVPGSPRIPGVGDIVQLP